MKKTQTRYIALMLCAIMTLTSAPMAVFADHLQSVTVGDVDGNGSINAKDAVLLFRSVAGWEVDANEDAMDVDQNGKVNAADAVRLFRYVAGWDIDIGGDEAKPEHVYDQKVANETYFAQPATCTEAARYYYSCECGHHTTEATFSYGEPLGHTQGDELNYDDESGHYYVCTVCGDPVDHTEHIYDREVTTETYFARPATCTEAAHYYYSCECGHHTTEATFSYGEPLGHTKGDELNYDDETGHYYVCTVCGEALDKADHVYNVYNACDCGYALEKLYTFGALSDVHVTDERVRNRFRNTLAFMNDVENVDFVCICGDLTGKGTVEQYQDYAGYVQEYANGTPVYEITGNHDVETFTGTTESIKPYTGEDLYYTFEQGNDLFVMFGMQGWKTTGETFSDESLAWLDKVLSENTGKRVFLFEHVPRWDGSGVPIQSPSPTGNILLSRTGTKFKSILEKYENVVWFHGHTHITFEWLDEYENSIYDYLHGCHSVHIPSLNSGRHLKADGTGWQNNYNEGYGYVIDVYENSIVIRPRDFATNEFISEAVFKIDTTM